MSITPEDVQFLAAEAKLKITHEEMPEIIKYMNRFITELERMNELELKPENVSLLYDYKETESCPMRDDDIEDFAHRDDLLRDAPLSDGNYFRTARILEK